MDKIQKRRNIYFDYLRGMAAIGVLLFHYTTRYDIKFGHILNYPINLPLGRYCVGIFFLFCGYFGMVALKRENRPVQYLSKRAFRLYPSYWVASILIFIVTSLFMQKISVSFKDLLLNFTMLQSFLGGNNVDGAFWTLPYELIFYFDIFLILLLRLDKFSEYIVFLWSVLQFLRTFIPVLALPPFSYFYKLANPFMLRNFGHMFTVGMALCFIRNSGVHKKLMAIAVILMGIVRQFYTHDIKYSWFFAASVIVIYLLDELFVRGIEPTNLIKNMLKPLAFIAGISYPLYLIHQNIGHTIIYHMEAVGLQSEIFLCIPITVSILLAVGIQRYVETPFARLEKKLTSRYNKNLNISQVS